jgi:hypothetical protein
LTHFKLLEASPVAFSKAGSVEVSDGSYWKRPDYVPAIEAMPPTSIPTGFSKRKHKIKYSLRPELDGPPAAQPIKLTFCENPLPGTFLLPRGPKIEIRDVTEPSP